MTAIMMGLLSLNLAMVIVILWMVMLLADYVGSSLEDIIDRLDTLPAPPVRTVK